MDCLPYKISNNIPEKMKIPPGAIPDSTVISFVYMKDGKEVEFTAAQFPADFDDTKYKFVKRYDKVVRKGNAEAPIKDFSLNTFYGNDTTQSLLEQDREQLYLFVKNGYSTGKWTDQVGAIVDLAKQKKIDLFLVTNLPWENLQQEYFNGFIKLQCDVVAIKTAARANPTLMRVRGGTILGKWSYADFETAFEKISTVPDNQPLPLIPGNIELVPFDSTTK
jgi:hypothetical protein